MLKLGVNVDHVATLRQARGTDYPSPLEAALLCVDAGAHGITVHLREDRRHIQDADVHDMRAKQPLPLNLEMAHSAEIVDLALKVKPDEVCLVPEKREERTTEGGLDVAGQTEALAPTIEQFKASGIIVSPFIEPDPIQIDACTALGVPMIELHTGAFCEAKGEERARLLQQLIAGAKHAHNHGLLVNAGHGIHLGNLEEILEIPHLHTLNIGHSIISHAVMVGMKAAVTAMLEAMADYSG